MSASSVPQNTRITATYSRRSGALRYAYALSRSPASAPASVLWGPVPSVAHSVRTASDAPVESRENHPPT
ncbi:hypothetical protein GCM10010358_69140 [Streptomyces minutiscleroticus]|uniref:Uncharacterized protein n=1 Tax=Streptomyces minutiscleroticus TaxID=68238 RepID=A0A918U7J4_9ACTN|nr:hypothetical protein GCM10010358_69140 [Streptomyces minutiscleroticus]